MSHADEFEVEPVRGLPAPLPEGETMLWQGEPQAGALARRAFHVRAVALYFGVLLAWRAVTAVADGEPLAQAVTGTLWVALAAAAALGLLVLLAWANARTTVYTITSRRIVMRFGIALPMTVNLPFRVIEAAAVRTSADGTGDIPLTIAPGERISYLVMWPHVRPWRLSRPEPMLRGIPDAARVAETLSRALASAAGPAVARATAAAPEEGRRHAPQPLATATH